MSAASSSVVDWSDLPRELIVRICFHYRRAKAATRIQAVWRGRDLRNFLEHPASKVLNSRHPRFGEDHHARTCPGCFMHELYVHNTRHEVFSSTGHTGAWSVRCLYLVAYDQKRVRYEIDS